MADQEEVGGRKVVRSATVKRIEEPTSDPVQPRRLFIDSPAPDIEEEEFLPSDPQSSNFASVGDAVLIDEDGKHHVVQQPEEKDSKKQKEPNRPATEVNLTPDTPAPASKKG